jgi:hypothetical protein
MKEEEKLQNTKNRLKKESLALKQKEKKFSERRIIEFGSIVNRLDLDIDVDVFLGAMLHIKKLIGSDSNIKDKWREEAGKYRDNLVKLKNQKRGVILKIEDNVERSNFDESCEKEIRNFGLKWNSFRREWGGYVMDYEGLVEYLDSMGVKYRIDEV